MKTTTNLVLVTIACLAVSATFCYSANAIDHPTSAAELCTGATAGTMDLGGIGWIVHYCRNRSIYTSSAATTRAIIVIPGTESNVKTYYDNVVAWAGVARMAHMDVIVPLMLHEDGANPDVNTTLGLPANHLHWSNQWRYGGNARNHAYSSYKVIDHIVTKLLQNRINLQHIAIVGHSAGGQLVERYAATTRIESDVIAAGKSMSFGVSAPDIHLWLNPAYPDAAVCAVENKNWPVGTNNLASVPYVANRTYTEIRENLIFRHVYYIVGDQDTTDTVCPNPVTTDCCNVRVQGIDRLDRQQNHAVTNLVPECLAAYGQVCWLSFLANPNAFSEVPGVAHGHNGTLGSADGRDILFLWE